MILTTKCKEIVLVANKASSIQVSGVKERLRNGFITQVCFDIIFNATNIEIARANI